MANIPKMDEGYCVHTQIFFKKFILTLSLAIFVKVYLELQNQNISLWKQPPIKSHAPQHWREVGSRSVLSCWGGSA
jgi:hypothetical protein